MDEEGLMDIDDLKLQLQFYQTTRCPMLDSFSACSIATGICSVLCLACFTSLEHSHALISQQAVVDGYDAITLSPHKFLGRPGSLGILLMNKALYQLKNSPPSTCGTVNYVNYNDEKLFTYFISSIAIDRADGQSKLRVTTVTRRWVETADVTKVPWSNEHPLEKYKELNAIIGAWFTLCRD
nr:hypothetical protein [Tanacetum cinerariifolium]